MILQLYSEFSRLTGEAEGRIAPLPDATEAVVTQELNGEWRLDVEYPQGGLHAGEIRNGRVIMAAGNGTLDWQAYDIRSVRRSLTGGISVTAYHVSYRFNSIICRPWLNGGQPVTAKQAWGKTIEGLIGQYARAYAVFGTDKTTDEGVHILIPMSFRSAVHEVLVKHYGGIAEYNNLNLAWNLDEQTNTAMVITQRVDLLQLDSSAETQEIESGILPFYGRADDEQRPIVMTTTSIDYDIDVPLNVVPVDMTSNFETVPTATQLRAAGNAYKARRISEIIEASISISAIPTANAIKPGDLVEIVTDVPGAIGTRRVTEITYDCLREKTVGIKTGPTNRTAEAIIAALK